jgi:hypothetical protein
MGWWVDVGRPRISAKLLSRPSRLTAWLFASFVIALVGCSDASNQPKKEVEVNSNKSPPYLQVMGDMDDVGAEIFVDGMKVAVLEDKFLSLIRVYIVLEPGQREVEIRKNGVVRVKQSLVVLADSGQISIMARESYTK